MHTAQNRLLFTIFDASPVHCIIPREGEPKLVLTSSALEVARDNTWIQDIRTFKTGVYVVRPSLNSLQDKKTSTEVLVETLKEANPRKLGLETQWLDFFSFDRIRRAIPKAEMADACHIFKKLRMIKTEEEIRRFREATRICCRSIMKVIDSIRKGISERELQTILKETILREGGDSWHQTTIAAGPDNGPNIYHQPSLRKVADGDVIRIDVGCLYKGYSADNARTVVFGHAPGEAKKIYAAIKDATEKGISVLRPGLVVSDVHKLVRDEVRRRYDKNYTRGNVGHGVGIELYDDPEFTVDNLQELMPGMTVSIEAPYHKFGLGGFIVEDSVLITKDAHEVLTDMSRELFTV
jgi:Xaa-Pro aminopeptidase